MINIIVIRKGIAKSGCDIYTKLLLHMNGSNGSTTFLDSSCSAHIMTANGSASISTSQSKFGGTSGLFDGNTAGITAAGSADFAFGTGDFTIDFWAYSTQASPENEWSIFDSRPSGAATGLWVGEYNGSLYVYIGPTPVITVADLPVGAWVHVAVIRASGMLTLYLNGVAAGTYASTDNLSSQLCNVGTHWMHQYSWKGYLDEFRISNGVARWTSDFTPPTQQYTK